MKIGFLISLIQFWGIIKCSEYFSVYAPGTIRPNSKYDVAVSSFKDKSMTLNVGILDHVVRVELEPFSSEIIQFNISEISNQNYELKVEDPSNESIKKTYELTFEAEYYLVLIQTDKAVYKPGDLVRFRIIVLDKHTRPVKPSKPINFFISDAKNINVDFVENIQFRTGVFTSEYQLSKEPTIGHWTISVYENILNVKNKTFEVAEFVLPTFSVDVVTDQDILVENEKGTFSIESKYTFGKLVVGRATLIVETVENSKIFNKTVESNGFASFELNLKTELGLTSESTDGKLYVTAIVEEKFTGIKQNKSITVNIHSEKYVIDDAVLPKYFHPGKDIEIEVPIKTFQGLPVSDKKHEVFLYAESDLEETTIFKEYAIRGFAKFKVNLHDANSYEFRASYLQVEKNFGTLEKLIPNGLSLERQNNDILKIGENISLTVSSNESLHYFNYLVSTRGSVVKSEVVKLSDTNSLYEFNITLTFEMVPSCKVLVSTVQKGRLEIAELIINIPNAYNNKIELDVTTNVKPKDEIDFIVRTEAESFVGLLAVDKRTLLFKKGNDLSSTEIKNNLQSFDSDVIILTNAEYSAEFMAQGCNDNGISPEESSEIREYFPETWIWLDIPNIKEEMSIRQKLPDTITSWILTGFALHPEKGLVLTEEETEITALKKLFVNFELPYSVKLGEVLSIEVLVFNYESKTLSAEVLLRNDNQEFEFVNEDDDENNDPHTKFISVNRHFPGSVTFKIRPKKVGFLPLTVELKNIGGGGGGDILKKLLRVEPSGITKYFNKDIYIKLNPDNPNFKKTFKLVIPKNAVPNSDFAKVSVVGNIMGPTIRNLDDLIRLPKGCGEQLMVDFVPNILVLRYLNAINQLSDHIKDTIIKNLKVGYEKLLDYRNDDGSFSVFQESYQSTWLTAYIARFLQKVQKHIYVDENVIKGALEYLVLNQENVDGNFKENEIESYLQTIESELLEIIDYYYHYEMDEEFDNIENDFTLNPTDPPIIANNQNLSDVKNNTGELSFTAFVLTAFLENSETASKYEAVVEKGVKYIASNIDKTDDVFAQAISAYVLKLAGHEKADDVLAKLKIKAMKKGDQMWWQFSENRRSTHDVEITGYILMALSKTQLTNETLPIVNWLLAQRNSNGGFDSTQDTVVGLSALTKFTEMTYTDIGISVTALGQTYKFHVNQSNSLILQSHDLESGVKTVDIEVDPNSKGSCLVQISYQYNIEDPKSLGFFNLNVTWKQIEEKVINVVACTSKPQGESNMAYIEIQLPSGFTAQKGIFINNFVRKVEYQNQDNIVVAYFDSIKDEEICVDIKATRTFEVYSKKAYVTVRDFYDSTKFVRKSYLVF